jgi:hypothetical protein
MNNQNAHNDVFEALGADRPLDYSPFFARTSANVSDAPLQVADNVRLASHCPCRVRVLEGLKHGS